MKGKSKDITVANKIKLATILGVGRVTLDLLIEKGLPVQKDPGRYGKSWEFHLPTVVQWYADYKVNENMRKNSMTPGGETRQEAERKQAVIKARLAEIELDEKLKSVVPVEEVGKMWDAHNVRCRQRFLGVGKKVAPQLVGEENEKKIAGAIEEFIIEALEELSIGDVAEEFLDDLEEGDFVES